MRRELVHDPAGHAGGEDLGLERSPGDLPPIGELQAGGLGQGAGSSATESAVLDERPEPVGTVDVTVAVEADRLAAPVGERAQHPGDEPPPGRLDPRRVLAPVGGEVDRARHFAGPHRHPAPRPGAARDHALAVDREREAEAVVVVRVVADEVDPSRRPEPDHRGTVAMGGDIKWGPGWSILAP